MKKIEKTIILVFFMFCCCVAFGQTPKPSTYTKDGKTFIKVEQKQDKRKSSYVPTGYYVEYKGKTYQVYSHVFTRGKRKGQAAYFIVTGQNKEGKPTYKELSLA